MSAGGNVSFGKYVMECPYCQPDATDCPGYGRCHCGCGEPTNIAPTNTPTTKIREHYKYVSKHMARDPKMHKRINITIGNPSAHGGPNND